MIIGQVNWYERVQNKNKLELDLEKHPDGVLLYLKVQPNAKRNAIMGLHAGQLKVSVTVVPEKGKANQAVIKLVAKVLKIAKSDLEIVKGQTSSQKKILVRETTLSALREKIEGILLEG